MFADDERLNYLIVLLDLPQNTINEFALSRSALVAGSLDERKEKNS